MRRALALTALTLAALALPASAGAAGAPTGSTNLVVLPGKAKALKKRGIGLRGVGGVQTSGRASRLQIVGGEIGAGGAAVTHRGALRLRAGKGRARRAVFLRRPEVRLAPYPRLIARLGGKRRAIFNLRGGELAINDAAKTAHLLRARAVWLPGALKTVRRKLRAKVPAGALGILRTRTAVLLDQPYSQPVSEVPRLARPASAVDVAGAALTWHLRDSWVRYVGSEVAEPLGGAAPLPPYPGESHPCPDNPTKGNPLAYSYALPFGQGWYDPVSGTAALSYAGGLRFAYPARAIDLTLRNPIIELNGPASRAIFSLRGSGATAYPDSRAAIMSLDTSRPLIGSTPGTLSTDGQIKATLNADGEKVFAGFYTGANAGFGCFELSFTTP